MVNGDWSKVTLICGNHEEPVYEMELKQGRAGMSVFDCCPCYQSPDQNGRKCNNRLNIVDYEWMLNTLYDESISEEGSEVNLIGLKIEKRGVECQVIGQDEKGYKVVMKNNKAVRN